MSFKRTFLKGVDYFQLLIDHHARRKGGPGHQAHLTVYLQGAPDEQTVVSWLEKNETASQIARARVSKSGGLGYPSVYFIKSSEAFPVQFVHADESRLPEIISSVSIDPFQNAPAQLTVIYFPDHTTCLLFSFSHILFDFAGVQSFIRSLAGMGESPLFPEKVTTEKFAVRFKRFFRAVFFAFREGTRSMTIPERKLPQNKNLRIGYHEYEFSADETIRIYETMGRSGYGLNRSIPEIATVCTSLHQHIFSKQKHHEFIWLPVPVNNRRKGTADAVFFNGLTFLFYKITESELNNASSSQDVAVLLTRQMKDQVNQQLPAAFTDFTNGYWYMPMPFYYPMMQLPSWGKLSTFSFSTLGKTFEGVDDMLGCKITNMVNYPSNTITPGITFLFYEYQNKLRIMSSWVKEQYSEEEQKAVMKSVVDRLQNFL
jgi:hypothetical protein